MQSKHKQCILYFCGKFTTMDPWQPLNCNSYKGDLVKTGQVTLTTVLPEFPVRKTMDSSQYLSIIGKTEKRLVGERITDTSDPRHFGPWTLRH